MHGFLGILMMVAGLTRLHAMTPNCLSAIKSALTQVHEEETFRSGFEAKVAFEELKKNMEEKVKSMSDAELAAQLDTWIRNTIAFRSTLETDGYLPGQAPETRTRTLAELLDAERKKRTSLANIIANAGGIMTENSAEFAFDHSLEMANSTYNSYKKIVYPSKMLEELHRRIHKDNYPEIYHREAAKAQFQNVKTKTETQVQRMSSANLIAEVSTHYVDAIDLMRQEVESPGSFDAIMAQNPAYQVETNIPKHFGAGQATLVDSLAALKQYESYVYKLKILAEFQTRMREGRLR